MILSNISKKFGNRVVLKGIHFDFECSTIYMLSGPNGSGKTTLFNILSGFVKQDEGAVIVENRDISSVSPHKRANLGIGRSFQNVRLIPTLSVEENIVLSLPHRRLFASTPELNDFIFTYLTISGLISHLSKPAESLSYGQQKLLSLCCVIASSPKYILFDEPSSGLSPVHLDTYQNLLMQLKRDGKTIICIEHNNVLMESVGDKLLFLSGGVLCQFSSYQNFSNDFNVLRAYL